MSFKSGVRSASEHVFGEFLCELPGMLLDGCNDIEGLFFMTIVLLIVCGVLVIFLGTVTVVADAFSPSGFQQLGLK